MSLQVPLQLLDGLLGIEVGRQAEVHLGARFVGHNGLGAWADELAETRALCLEAGGACEIGTVDVTRRDEVFGFVVAALRTAPQVDILVNNAGGVLGQTGRPLEDVPLEDWQGIFDVNVTGAFMFCQAVAPGMKAARQGRIVNISSGAGSVICNSRPEAGSTARPGGWSTGRRWAAMPARPARRWSTSGSISSRPTTWPSSSTPRERPGGPRAPS